MQVPLTIQNLVVTVQTNYDIRTSSQDLNYDTFWLLIHGTLLFEEVMWCSLILGIFGIVIVFQTMYNYVIIYQYLAQGHSYKKNN